MSSNKNNSSKVSTAQNAIADYLLQEPGKFFSFKQLKKKFKRFDKDELHAAVQQLLEEGFLQPRGTQFQYVARELKENGESENEYREDIMEGVIDMISSGHAYVISPDSEKDIWIDRRNQKTALDGDSVRVMITRRRKKGPEGKVLKITKRATDTFIGVIQSINRQHLFIPDKKIDVNFLIPPDKLGNANIGDKVVVKMIDWQDHMPHPTAEVVKVLGKVGANETEMQAILLESGFRLEFPKEVLHESQDLKIEIDPEEIANRRDFRDVTTFTIDPEDAKDFDDALSFRILNDGMFEIGIHIADVTHYIKPNTQLEKEAALRTTSVYLVDRCVPMLPEKLSNGVCSLSPEADKLCFSVVVVMDENGEVKDQWMGKTIIHSNRRFSYEGAHEILEGKRDLLSEPLKILNTIAKQLRQRRFKNGAINFDTVEVKFRLDDQARPVEVFVKERKDTHLLIEEFMLLANRKVAEFIGLRKGREIPFVYRIHDLPDDEKLKDFAEFAMLFGYKLNFTTPRHIAHSINKMMVKLHGKPEQYMLESLAIRTMAKAIYSTKNIGHYGLAFDYYTHFTSPIRRYPDMMAHRILEKVLSGDKVAEHNLEQRCNHSSEMERGAAEAERTSVKLKQVEFMESHTGEVFAGIISGVTDWGIFVLTEDSFCEGLIRLESIHSDFFVYDQKKHCIKGMRTGKKFQLGDKVNVRLIGTNLSKRTIDFAFADD
ncbi:MAG: ribonuclease R [Chitinophagales bacterium]|nr:ribonuclease R [Chitinophagales bacterium]